MAKVYDKKGNEYNVPHSIDVKEWLDQGYAKDKPEPKATKQKDKPEPKEEE